MGIKENLIKCELTQLKNNHLVSIIIPVFNEENSIRKILDLIKTQFNSYEIIVVDGGSTDGTVEAVLEKGVKLIRQKSKGYENAVLDGILSSKGDYVVIFDSDMTYDPSDIDKMLIPLFNNEADFVIGERYNPHIKQRNIKLTIGYSVIKYIFNILFNMKLSDPSSSFRALKLLNKSLFNQYSFDSAYETIAILKENNYRIVEIKIKYYDRLGVSTKHPIFIGFDVILKILKAWYKIKWCRKNE